MSIPAIELTRAELYERVWTTPIRTLAKEFGLSDVGLAKLCRRHEIPLPGRGHWARIQFGQKPKSEPLPPAKDPRLDAVTIQPSDPRHRMKFTPIGSLPIAKIAVAEDRPISHPLATRIEHSISRKNTDDRGILLTNQERIVPLKVCSQSLSRALRIIDALFTAVDETGFELEWLNPYDAPLKIVIQGEKLQLLITEIIERKEHKPTAEELSRRKTQVWWGPKQWDYAPTSRLRITLESCEYPHICAKWTDGKRRKLEDCLGETLIACDIFSASIKKERAERTEAARLRQDEEKRRAEEAVRRAEYERKAEAVKELANAWHEGKLIRAFANDLRMAAADAVLSEDKKQEIHAIVQWSLDHADYVDPITDLEWTIAQFEDRE
jgi:hypothetical protein